MRTYIYTGEWRPQDKIQSEDSDSFGTRAHDWLQDHRAYPWLAQEKERVVRENQRSEGRINDINDAEFWMPMLYSFNLRQNCLYTSVVDANIIS